MVRHAVDDTIDDDELASLALAAPADPVLGPDAVPFRAADDENDGPLPAWYMPPARSTTGSRRRRWVIGVLVASFVVVNGAGLCVTYGFPEIAW